MVILNKHIVLADGILRKTEVKLSDQVYFQTRIKMLYSPGNLSDILAKQKVISKIWEMRKNLSMTERRHGDSSLKWYYIAQPNLPTSWFAWQSQWPPHQHHQSQPWLWKPISQSMELQIQEVESFKRGSRRWIQDHYIYELALRTSEAAAGVNREDSHWKDHAG